MRVITGALVFIRRIHRRVAASREILLDKRSIAVFRMRYSAFNIVS